MHSRETLGLAVLLAAALLLSAAPADAQIPNVQVYFDENLQHTQGFCQGETVLDTLYLVANNFNMFLSTIEFKILYPQQGQLIWINDLHTNNPLWLGFSPTGITITWPAPQNAYGPLPFMAIEVLWVCDECETFGPWSTLVVVPHPGTGKLQAIRWPDFVTIDPVGMTSIICPQTIANEETTWGRVKALYRE